MALTGVRITGILVLSRSVDMVVIDRETDREKVKPRSYDVLVWKE